jgi:multidrug efflux pump subunit AcrA (membrane-fusion protein)
VEETSRTFDVEVRVPNPKRQLKAGSFARAWILAPAMVDVPMVPEEAVVRFAGVTKVFIVKDEKALAVEVRTGERLPITTDGRTVNWVEVRGNLPPGSQVVTSGHSQLADGTPVRIREAAR